MTSVVAVNGNRQAVYGAGGVRAQIAQIYMDYGSLPSPREITLDEIKFFYGALIEGLCDMQKQLQKQKKPGRR